MGVFLLDILTPVLKITIVVCHDLRPTVILTPEQGVENANYTLPLITISFSKLIYENKIRNHLESLV